MLSNFFMLILACLESSKNCMSKVKAVKVPFVVLWVVFYE